MSRVVNIRKEKCDVYIGRGSKWGNPFHIGPDGNRTDVIIKYEEYIRNKPELLKDLHELKGKTLGCYCAPLPCHGDILIKLLEERKNVMNDLIFKIYTDGASSNNQNAKERIGGYGFILYAKQLSTDKEFSPRTGGDRQDGATNNQMELHAIFSALIKIKSSISSKARVEIHTDSQYCIDIWCKTSKPGTPYINRWRKNGFKTAKKKPVENQEFIHEIDEMLSRFADVEFFYVEGHSGDIWNEYVDKVARYYTGKISTMPDMPKKSPFEK